MYRFRTDPAENEECQKNDEAEKARVSMGKTLFIEDPKRLRQCSEVVEVNNGAWDETVLYQATQFRALGYMFQWVGANFRGPGVLNLASQTQTAQNLIVRETE